MGKKDNVKIYEIPEGFRDNASTCDGTDDGKGCIAADAGNARFPWRQLESTASIPKVRRWYQFLPSEGPSASAADSELYVDVRVFPDVGKATVAKFVSSSSTARPRPAPKLTTPQLDTLTDALDCFVRRHQVVPQQWASLHPASTLHALVPGGQKRICSESGKVRSVQESTQPRDRQTHIRLHVCCWQNSVYRRGQDIYDTVVMPTMIKWLELPFWRQFGFSTSLYNARSTPCTMAKVIAQSFALVTYKVGGGEQAITRDGNGVFPTNEMLPSNIACPTSTQLSQAAAQAAAAAAQAAAAQAAAQAAAAALVSPQVASQAAQPDRACMCTPVLSQGDVGRGGGSRVRVARARVGRGAGRGSAVGLMARVSQRSPRRTP